MVELYGKCRQLGYCDCGGFFNCVDDKLPANPGQAELAAAVKAEKQMAKPYKNHNLKHEVKKLELEQPEKIEKPCGYCKRRGAPCSRHGGERSGVYTSKKAVAAGYIAPSRRSIEEEQKPAEVIKVPGKNRIVIEVGNVKITIEAA